MLALILPVCAGATTLTYTHQPASNAVPDGVLVKLLTTNTGTVSNATIGAGNGADFTYSGTLPAAKLPIEAGSVIFKIGSITFTDDGAGKVGHNSPQNSQTGTINYATGAYTLVYPGTGAGSSLGAVNGTQQTFTGTLVPPVKPGSVSFTVDQLGARDNAGTFTTNGSTGTIDYASGAYSVTFYYPPRSGNILSVNYRNAPPTSATPITVSYRHATAAGRDVADNVPSHTLEAAWFGVTAGASNGTTRAALQKAVGAAERWAIANPSATTTLLLPAGTLQFGDYANPVRIRYGHFTLKGSGTRATLIKPLAAGSSRALTIESTASHLTLDNLKFDLASNHQDYCQSVYNLGNDVTVTNCEFTDSTAVNYGDATGTIGAIISNWVNSAGTYTAQVQVNVTPGHDISWLSLDDVKAYIYDSTDQVLRSYCSVGSFTAPDIVTLTTTNTPQTLVVGDRVAFAEHFTRQSIQNGGSNFTITGCLFTGTQLRAGIGEDDLTENVLVDGNTFINSQAYCVSCVGRTRSNGASQIKRNVTISNNVFNGFQRGAVYIGLDWGEALQNSTVMENFTITGNDVIINRQWEGNEGVFITRTGRINRNLIWSDNIITFTQKPVSAPIFFNMIRMPFASFEGGGFVENLVTFDPSLATTPRFSVLFQLGGTRDFLVAGNTFDVGGEFLIWRGGENVVVEDNIFKNVRRLVRAENMGRFSFVGNDIQMASTHLDELFYLRADTIEVGDVTVANNRITLPPTGTADLVEFDLRTGGQFRNVAMLNSNILTGGARPFYSGSYPIVRILPGAANWTFDEGFGTTAGDGSVNQNHLTLNNGATWAGGARELALSLDGANDYASIPSNSSFNFTSDFSISAWVYMTGGGVTRAIVSKVAHNTWYQYLLSIYNGKLTFQQKYGTGDSRFSAGTVPANRWVHVAATISPTQFVTLYVDGKQTGAYQSTVIPAASTNALCVGRKGGSSPGDYFMGSIDELQIHSGVLTAGDIQRVAFGRSLGYWRMEENTGITLGDESGLNNAGILTNGPAWTTGIANGKALQFDGIDDYVDIGSPSSLNTLGTFTVSAWIYSTTIDGTVRTIISKSQDSTKMIDLTLQNDQLTFTYGNGFSIAGTGIVPNTWQHVAASVDAYKSVRLYIDGSQIAAGTAPAVPDTTGVALNIGRRGGSFGSANVFKGKIDEVELYDRAVRITEIRALAEQ
jgi:hypothetical protein